MSRKSQQLAHLATSTDTTPGGDRRRVSVRSVCLGPAGLLRTQLKLEHPDETSSSPSSQGHVCCRQGRATP